MADLSRAKRRRIVAGSTLGAGLILATALFLIVNYLGEKYHRRFDWTSSRLYTLSEKSANVVEGLERDVDVVILVSPAEGLYGPISELLQQYETASPRISVRRVDPEKNPLEAEALVDRYELSQLSVVVFDDGVDRRVVDIADIADYDYSGLQFGQGPEMTGFKGEQAFTGTLLDLAESRKPRILFTTGHGELALDDFSPEGLSEARELLGSNNFELESWASLGRDAVPQGVDLVVVAGPISSFVAPEIDLLRAYLDGGGRMLVMLDPVLSPGGGLVVTGLEALLAEYGVEVGRDVVVDPGNPLPFFGAETIFVESYGDHEITRSLAQAMLPVIVPMARSVGPGEEEGGLELTELMRTTAEGWGETNLIDLQEVAPDDEDLAGPVPLAVAVRSVGEDAASSSEEGSRPELRLVVVGDADFAANERLLDIPNATFLANALNWLVERENLLAIEPKSPEQVRLGLSAGELARVTLLVLVVLPGLAVLLGVTVHWRRRR